MPERVPAITLILHPDSVVRLRWTKRLSQMGVEHALEAERVAMALRLAKTWPIEVVFTPFHHPEGTLQHLVEALKEEGLGQPRIVVLDEGVKGHDRVEVVKLGAVGLVPDPPSDGELHEIWAELFEVESWAK